MQLFLFVLREILIDILVCCEVSIYLELVLYRCSWFFLQYFLVDIFVFSTEVFLLDVFVCSEVFIRSMCC